MKYYCTQNEGQCETCSLVNYNKDCMNCPVIINCAVCGQQMEYDTDRGAGIIWYSCPVYLAGPEGQEHDSFSRPIAGFFMKVPE